MPFSDPEKYGKHRFSPRIIIYPLVLLAAVWFMNKQQKIIEATKRQNENTQPPLQRMAVVPTTDSGELKLRINGKYHKSLNICLLITETRASQ